jgi:hypothetical protein
VNFKRDVVDKSLSKHVLTLNGGAAISAAQSYYNGGSSLYLDGSGDYASTPDSDEFDFGTGDFTLKCKINFTTVDSGGADAFITHRTDGDNLWQWYLSGGNTVIFYVRLSATTLCDIEAGWTPATGRWYDIMVVRRSGVVTHYVDGLPLANSLNTGPDTDITNISAELRIGSFPGLSYDVNAYIQDVMVIKGEAWDDHKFYNAALDAKSSYLKAGWKFGDYGVYDCIGTNHLTNSGVTFATAGLQGYKCGVWDGSSYAYRASTSDFDFTNAPFTISMFIKFNGDPGTGTQGFMSKLTLGNLASIWQFYFQGDAAPAGAIIVYGTDAGESGNIDIEAGWNPAGDVWYHVCLTRSGSDWKFYINGDLLTNSLNTGASLALPTTEHPLLVGNKYASQYFNGSMQDVLIYKGTALTIDEVALLYNAGKAKLLELEHRQHKQRFNNSYLDSYSKYLVAGWNLDEMSGARYDNAGLNHLTDTGGVTYTADAVHGNVATFDGSTQYLTVASSADLNVGAGDFSICFWFNQSSTSLDVIVIDKRTNGTWTDQLYMGIRNEGGVNTVEANINNGTLISKAYTPDTGVWHFVVWTRSSGSNVIYLDTVAGTPATNTGDASNSHELYIGAETDNAMKFAGKLSAIKIYKGIALDATAISNLYNDGLGRKLSYKNSIDNYNTTTKLLSPYPTREEL